MTKVQTGLIIGGIILISVGVFFNTVGKKVTAPTVVLKEYVSTHHTLSFKYHDSYYLEEKEVGNGERSHHFISLTEDTEENKQVREGTAPPREGPTAITVDIFQNNLDNMNAEKWITETNNSNFKLSPDGILTKATVGGKEATSYRWSGLYEGKSVVVATPEFVYMFSVSYLTPEDVILRDFDALLATVNVQ